MDHVVYLNWKAKELENLLSGKKSMIIRGGMGKKMPHGRVSEKDVLYFINSNTKGEVKAKGIIKSVLCSNKLTQEESIALVDKNQNKLKLTEKQYGKWAGKRYLVLVEVSEVDEIKSFYIDKSDFSNMDDWLMIGNIKRIKK